MHHSLERELCQHATALRRIARDLVGDSHADDLVQETALQALAAPPRRPGPIGGWLAGIVRHLASRHHRSERRRRRREECVARPERQPPDAALEDRDALRQLTEAVLALPEPYRGALFLRYLQDLTPSAIARQSGESVETVKSRLRRGLALLRERFDRQGGGWRAAFTVAFRLAEVPVGPVVGTVVGATGAFFMATGIKVAVGGGALVLALAAGLYFVGDGAPAATPVAAAGTTGAAPVAAAAPGEPARAGTDAATGTLQRTEVAVPALANAAPATIRGRCVDEQGIPLAGVWATMRGEFQNERSAGDPPRKDEHPPFGSELATAADGTFEFRFALPPSYGIRIELEHPRLVPLTASWKNLQPGDIADMGAIVLLRGWLVTGRVITTDGAPVPGVRVRLTTLDTLAQFKPRAPAKVHTSPDGAFAFPTRMPAADYRVEVDGEVIERGQRLRLSETTDPTLAIVVSKRAHADRIAGVVVDDQGRPLAGVNVSGAQRSVTTGAEGRFQLPRGEHAGGEPVRLQLQQRGYERLSTEAFPWGRDDVRLVLWKALAVEVRVVTAADGRPVEDCRVRVFPKKNANEYDLRPRAHPAAVGGVVLVEGIRRGASFVHVEPLDDALGASTFVPVEVAEPGPVRVEVRLPARAQRALRLQRVDGTPAAGSKVQLVDPVDGEPGVASLALPITRWQNSDGPRVLLIAQATTDVRGEAVLRGPAGRPLALLAHGPGHLPQVFQGVALGEDAPLVLTVGDGARLEGRVRPDGVLAALRRHAGLTASGPVENARFLPGFRIRCADGSVLPPMHLLSGGAPAAAIKADGTFVLEDLPPGRCGLLLHAWRASGGGWIDDSETVADVELRAGATATVDVDLSGLVPGELEGQLLGNGQPLAEEPIVVYVDRGRLASRAKPQEVGVDTRTDREGRFRVSERQGTFRVQWRRPDPPNKTWAVLRAAEEVFVPAGARVAQTFQVRSGKVRLRLTDGAGAPVAGVALVLFDAAGRRRQELPASDADGRIEREIEAEPFVARVLPKSRALQEARQPSAWPGPADAEFLAVGAVSATMGQTTELELRLPPEWDR